LSIEKFGNNSESGNTKFPLNLKIKIKKHLQTMEIQQRAHKRAGSNPSNRATKDQLPLKNAQKNNLQH
jgi:hypothetical protein